MSEVIYGKSFNIKTTPSENELFVQKTSAIIITSPPPHRMTFYGKDTHMNQPTAES